MTSVSIAFRVDASIDIGAGHVIRCLALAESLRLRGAFCVFICRAHPGHLIDRIRDRGFAVESLPYRDPAHLPRDPQVRQYKDWLGCGWHEDLTDTQDVVRSLLPAWLVVDHYAIDSRWEQGIRSLGPKLLVIDDLTDRRHDCDVLLNQNLGARLEDYAELLHKSTRLLIGPRFALVRPEFTARRPPASGRRPQNRWLACVGGTDPHRILEKILAAWEQLPQDRPELDVAVGNQTPNLDVLVGKIARMSGVRLHAPAGQIADLMAGADFLLCAGGTINWERCCLGVPAIMGMIALNQRTVLSELVRARTAIGVGAWQEVTAARLAELIRRVLAKSRLARSLGLRAYKAVDGLGTRRVSSVLLPDRIDLRPATGADAAWALRCKR